jgi:hypothetical protein
MYQLATIDQAELLANSDLPQLFDPGTMGVYLDQAALGETPWDQMTTLSKAVAVGGLAAVIAAIYGAATKRPRLTKNAAGFGIAAGGILALVSGAAMAAVHRDLTEAGFNEPGTPTATQWTASADADNSSAFGHLIFGAPILLASGAALLFMPTSG